MNLNKLKYFLEKEVLYKDIVSLKNLNQGGSSTNLVCDTEYDKFFIKVLPDNRTRANKLLKILDSLKNIPEIYTAHLIDFNQKQYFEFENNIILIMEFIKGRKIKYKELNNDFLDRFYNSYQHVNKLKLDDLPQRIPQEIYATNKALIKELKKNNTGYIKNVILNRIEKLNENLNSNISFKNKPVIIHGDVSLNNAIEDINKNIALLDFELIRYGYPVEDMAELLLSSLLQHCIFIIPKKHMEQLIKHINKIFNFTHEQWLYGINLYFLNLVYKRLKSKKLFNSMRKSILFTLNIKKYNDIKSILNKIY